MVKECSIGKGFLGGDESDLHCLGPFQRLGSGLAARQGLVEWLESMGGVEDKAVVEIDHTDEAFKALDIDRLGVSLDSLNLCR